MIKNNRNNHKNQKVFLTNCCSLTKTLFVPLQCQEDTGVYLLEDRADNYPKAVTLQKVRIKSSWTTNDTLSIKIPRTCDTRKFKVIPSSLKRQANQTIN